MTGNIIDALCREIQALFASTGISVMRDTQFKAEQMPLYTVPFIIVDVNSSPDTYQFIGGATACDFDFNIKSYFYDLNSLLDDDSGYSKQAYDLLDTIRQHIAYGVWLTQDMTDALNNYSFKLTLNGIVEDTQMQLEGGIVPGFSISYNSVSIDTNTTQITQEDYTTEATGITVINEVDIVYEQPEPNVIIGSNSPVAIGGSINLISMPNDMSYSWTGVDGFTSTLQNPTITNAQLLNAGTYTVTVTDAWGRDVSKSVDVVVQ